MSLPLLDTSRMRQLVKRWVKGKAESHLTPREAELQSVCEAFGTDAIALFDAGFYLSKNPDIAAAGIDPFTHFMRSGWREGRSPSANFNVEHYLTTYPDVRAQDVNPLVHYIESGFTEGRRPTGAGGDAISDAIKSAFDMDYYRKAYPDVAASGQDLLHHFLTAGWKENRNPSAQFSTHYYLSTYEDALESGLDPLSHYVQIGQKLGYLTQSVPGTATAAVASSDPDWHPDDDIELDSLPLNESRFTGLKDTTLVVSSVDGGLIRGIAHNPHADYARIDLLVGSKPVASSVCSESRHLAKRMGLPEKAGFKATIPLSVRYVNPNATGIRFGGKPSTGRRLDWRGRVHARALFIANASNPNDGSRIYRADLAAQQLRASGVEATVIAQENAFEQVAAGKLRPDDFDVVIFQRVPIISSSLNILELAKRKNRRVLYDVDDLMFKPWRRAEMGVIRSGQVKMDDAVYAESLRKRLRFLSLCDGVICSTPFLQRELNSLGMPAILSRNAVDDMHFINGAKRLAKPAGEGIKMMFMSGTPTHDADFSYIQEVVRDILKTNPNVTLTILGELRNRSLDGLPNVIRHAGVPRSRMFEIVAEQDVVLVPLERTPFNTAKSSLKFMECGAAGVPVIASDLFEFERDIRRSGGGMLARNPQEWHQALEHFIETPGVSHDYGLKAFRYCRDNYSVSSRQDYLWNEICRFDDHLLRQDAVIDRVNSRFGMSV